MRRNDYLPEFKQFLLGSQYRIAFLVLSVNHCGAVKIKNLICKCWYLIQHVWMSKTPLKKIGTFLKPYLNMGKKWKVMMQNCRSLIKSNQIKLVKHKILTQVYQHPISHQRQEEENGEFPQHWFTTVPCTSKHKHYYTNNIFNMYIIIYILFRTVLDFILLSYSY